MEGKNKKLIIACVIGVVLTVGISLIGGRYINREIDKKDAIVRAENEESKQVQIEMEEEKRAEKKDIAKEQIEKEEAKEVEIDSLEERIDNNREEVEFNNAIARTELTKETAKTLELQVRELYRNFQFAEADKRLQEISNEYKFTDKEISQNLEKLLLESSKLLHIEAYEDTSNPEIKINLIKGISDVENKMLSVLSVSVNERDGLIHDRRSINPEFVGGVKVTNITTLAEDSEIYKRAKLSDEALNKISVYEIEVEGNKLVAYMGEAKDRNYFYRLEEEVEGSTNYLTFSEWKDIKDKYGI